MPFKVRGSPFYQYDRTIKVSGQSYRLRGSTGERSLRAAREIEDEEVRAARHRILYGEERDVLTLTVVIGTYLDRVALHQPSARSSKSQAKALIKGIGKAMPLPEITMRVLSDHIAKRRAHVSNATVNREIAFLRRAFKFATKQLNAVAPDIDWSELRLIEPKGRVREATANEEARLWAEIREDYRDFFTFALLTGVRLKSARLLEWRDVDFDARIVKLRSMKGDIFHTIPMTNALLVLLANQERVCDLVFTKINQRTNQRTPISQDGWRKMWAGALDRAGVTDFRFHDLRHTALTRVTRVSDLTGAQALAGHRDIGSTARYAHVLEKGVRDAMDAISTQTPPRVADKRGK